MAEPEIHDGIPRALPGVHRHDAGLTACRRPPLPRQRALPELHAHEPRVREHPAARSTVGADDAAEALIRRLVKGAAVVTPNLPEAEVLTGRSIKTIGDMENAAEACRALGAQAVLLKGGHLEGDRLIDLLITPNDVVRYEHSRTHATAPHGTACTLAAATAELAGPP